MNDLLQHPTDRLALYRAIFDLVNQAAFVVDARDGRIVDVNQSACARLGADRQKLLAQRWSDVAAGMPTTKRRNVEVNERLFVVLADEPAQVEIERRGLPTDSLTGLANRDALLARLATADQGKLPRQLAVFFVDLDGFKQVNDTLGHLVGDRVLRVVAERLSASVRPTDLLVRYGGDEFVVLADGLHRQRDLERLARRIMRDVRQPIVVDGHTLVLSASVGIARRNAQLKTMDALIAEADRAMYRAKQLNRAAATSAYGTLPAAEALAGRTTTA